MLTGKTKISPEGNLKKDLKLINPGQIRVRIAPSPTGALHIGTARTALFNYLFSRKNNGSFVLRIEDTDLVRSKEKWVQNIEENLKWLGLQWDEGPDIGGKYGPYRQSERFEIYSTYIKKLLEEGRAYYCFCSKQELEAHRNYLLSIGQPPRYSGKCRNLSSEKVKEYLNQGKSYVIRLKVPEGKIEFNDIVRGKISFDASLLGDFIIARKADPSLLGRKIGSFLPLYNLACVIDDFEMKISHVIRGEDHISNTPKQILLQRALGMPQPKYAHIPLILDRNRAKLSKRENVVAVQDYKEDGYLPESLINFIALIGWNPKTPREIFYLPSLVQEFSLKNVQKGGAIFNVDKLNWLNKFYIKQKSLEKITELCIPYLIKSGYIKPVFEETQYPPAYGALTISQTYLLPETREQISKNQLSAIIGLYKNRLRKLSEISELIDFFFKRKLDYPPEMLRWKDMNLLELKSVLNLLMKILKKVTDENWNKEYLTELLLKEAAEFSKEDRGKLLWPLRVALTGKKFSASPFEIAEILGKRKVLERIQEARGIVSLKTKASL